MSTFDTTAEKCAACGKGDDGHKTCNGCKAVKYCDVSCQKAHRKQHMKQYARNVNNAQLNYSMRPYSNNLHPVRIVQFACINSQLQKKLSINHVVVQPFVVGACMDK